MLYANSPRDNSPRKNPPRLSYLAAFCFCLLPTLSLHALDTELISEAYDAPVPWDIADAGGGTPIVSADGSTVLFVSRSSNLVPGEFPNEYGKIYRWDAATDTVSALGDEPNASVSLQSISRNGRWVGLLSHATNLEGPSEVTPRGPPYPAQPYLFDTQTGQYQRLSGRATHVVVSPDGQRVALSRLNNRWNTNHVMIHDLASGTITDITPDANNRSEPVQFSADGRYLVFTSRASNLAEPPVPNGRQRAYLYDFDTGSTALVSRQTDEPDDTVGDSSVSISDDGQLVLFRTNATDLVTGANATTESGSRMVLLNRATGIYSYLLAPDITNVGFARLSGDGRFVALVAIGSLQGADSDNNFATYLFDRTSDELRQLTSTSSTTEALGSISASGQLVTYGGEGNGWVYSAATAETVRVTKVNGDPVAWSADGNSIRPQISNDGSVVTFTSTATNLEAAPAADSQPEIFAVTRSPRQIEQLTDDLREYAITSVFSALSGSGRYLAYLKLTSDRRERRLRLLDRTTGIDTELFPELSARSLDISDDGRFLAVYGCVDGCALYMVDTVERTLQLIVDPDRFADEIIISGDGNTVLFRTFAQNLIDDYPNPSYFRREYFSWDRSTNQVSLLVAGGLDAIAAQRPALSFDGRFVVFSSDACYQVDRTTRFVTPVLFSDRPSHCDQPDLSNDQRYLVFRSAADDLVEEGNVPGQSQVYVHDRIDDTVGLLTPHAEQEPRRAGSFRPVISGDGSTIAYHASLESLAPDGNNLTDVFAVTNPLLEAAPEPETMGFSAVLRANTRIVDLQATWPSAAQLTQVRELAVPGGVLWEGSELSWRGEYLIPNDIAEVTFNSRYFVDGVAFGSTTIDLVVPVVEPPSENGATLEGFVWIDANVDGRRSDNEAADVGREITVYRCNVPWGIAATATSTAPLGRWRVDGLAPGEYQIGTPAAGVEFSPVVNDNSVHENGFSNCVNTNDNPDEIGMGIVPGANEGGGVRGFAWIDQNLDGRRDATEPAKPGLTVTAFRCEAPWGVAGSTTTGSDGTFDISDVPPARYQFGVGPSGTSFSSLEYDNDIYPNGFSNCIDFTVEGARVGVGVVN